MIAVSLGDYAEYARSLGAADVIDYTAAETVEAVRERYPAGIDAVIDLVGIPDLTSSVATLIRSGGHVVSTVMPPDVEGLAARGVEGTLAYRMAAEHRFPEIAARIAKGEVKIPAIQMFPFEEAGRAGDTACAWQAGRRTGIGTTCRPTSPTAISLVVPRAGGRFDGDGGADPRRPLRAGQRTVIGAGRRHLHGRLRATPASGRPPCVRPAPPPCRRARSTSSPPHAEGSPL